MAGVPPSKITTFGWLLRAYRKDAGWSQPELARQLDKVGHPISTSAINKYELGHRRPGGEFIAYLARVFKMNDDEEIDSFFQALTADYLRELIDQYDNA